MEEHPPKDAKRWGPESVRCYIIEAQALFAFALAAVFNEAGLDLQRVSPVLEIHDLMQMAPDLLFIDTDFLEHDAIGTIELLRAALPKVLLCAYTSNSAVSWSRACHTAGANAIFSKAARKSEIVEGLRRVVATRTFIDNSRE